MCIASYSQGLCLFLKYILCVYHFHHSYMVMPFVAQDLGHIMKRKRLKDQVIIYLFYQILRGLKVCPSSTSQVFINEIHATDLHFSLLLNYVLINSFVYFLTVHPFSWNYPSCEFRKQSRIFELIAYYNLVLKCLFRIMIAYFMSTRHYNILLCRHKYKISFL